MRCCMIANETIIPKISIEDTVINYRQLLGLRQ